MTFETLNVRADGLVLRVEIAAPPMNLMGPELVRDLATLIREAEEDPSTQVIVFASADPDYFIAHIDVTRIGEYRDAASSLVGEPVLGLMFRHLSASRLVSIAQIEGRTGGAGSEFALACDMRFAARETAIFRQMESAFGAIPGAGAVQHLTRQMGRSRALEVVLGAEDYDADMAERYGWINRAMPAAQLGPFVSALAHRIARFPAHGRMAIKQRVDAISLPASEDLRRDASIFLDNVRRPEARTRIETALAHGFQTREAELRLAPMLELLGDR